jgi:hypothetical protein
VLPERPPRNPANVAQSASAVVGGSGTGDGRWRFLLLGLLAAGATGYLGAVLAERPLRAELALRPPVILLDLADAVRGVPPGALDARVADARDRAKRLAAGGFLVLDAQAVIAAPLELYLAPGAGAQSPGEGTP